MSVRRSSQPSLNARRSLAAAIVVLGLTAIGCGESSGPPRGAVSGKVAVDGQPLAEGVISFIPTGDTQGPSAGAEVKSGRYSIPQESGPVVGDYRVEVRAQKKTGRMTEVGSPAPPGTKIAETVEGLPAKYNSNSTIQKTIKAGGNSLDFELRTK